MQELPTDFATYISQLKYYERMHKVKEREQHIQEVSLSFITMFAQLHYRWEQYLRLVCKPFCRSVWFEWCWTRIVSTNEVLSCIVHPSNVDNGA